MKLGMEWKTFLYYMGLLVGGYYLALAYIYRRQLKAWWERRKKSNTP